MRPLLIFCIGLLLYSTRAHAIIVNPAQGDIAIPTDNCVGSMGGMTATAIAPRWLATANHVGTGGAGSIFYLNGQTYNSQGRYPHPSQDLALIKVDRDMAHYCPIKIDTIAYGSIVQLASTGPTRISCSTTGCTSGGAKPGAPHYVIYGQNRLQTNSLSMTGPPTNYSYTLAADFSASPGLPSSGADAFVPGEAGVVGGDSGGAILFRDNGVLRSIGIIAAADYVCLDGTVEWNCSFGALELKVYTTWIQATMQGATGATPTPTQTPTPTRTPTPTITATATRTTTPTPTRTPTSTVVIIATATRTPTPTRTPIIANTPIQTATATATRTATPAVTSSPTKTPFTTVTPTPTASAEASPTPHPTIEPLSATCRYLSERVTAAQIRVGLSLAIKKTKNTHELSIQRVKGLKTQVAFLGCYRYVTLSSKGTFKQCLAVKRKRSFRIGTIGTLRAIGADRFAVVDLCENGTIKSKALITKVSRNKYLSPLSVMRQLRRYTLR